ncbi:MAG: phage distal tail protein domain-containing protein [Bacillota bacterium]
MRTFKLWNADRSASFDLSSTSVQVTDVSGLGSNFKNKIGTLLTLGVNRSYTTNRQVEFEPIKMKIIFGIKSNAYTQYKSFMDFISLWFGQLSLEYQSNDRTIYADIEIKSAPKSQKNQFNIIAEDITWDRITPWYEYIDITGTKITINNSTNYMDIEPIVQFETATVPGYFLKISKTGYVDTIFLLEILQGLNSGDMLIIDSENKKIIYDDGISQTSAYDMVNHESYAFPNIPAGKSYDIYESTQTKTIRVKYKKWVID